MFQRFHVFILAVLSVAVEGEIAPPQNVSLTWVTDFHPHLSWTPPGDLGPDCQYEVAVNANWDESSCTTKLNTSPYIAMEGGSLQLSVRTDCGEVHSDWVHVNASAGPDLVQNVQCYIHSSRLARCSWLLPHDHAPDLRVFYRSTDEDGSSRGNRSTRVRECSTYAYGDGGGGCDLRVKPTQDVHLVFNATWNGRRVRNTFRRRGLKVILPPLNWTVVEAKDKFLISWIPPDLLQLKDWTFYINYTVCDEPKFKQVEGITSTELDRLAHCQYSMNIKATSRKVDTPLSDRKDFDKLSDPNALVYAAIIIPLLFAGLTVLIFVCFRRNKEKIFPKVIKPVDLINNNNIEGPGLYVPAPEEEDCKITLVIDP